MHLKWYIKDRYPIIGVWMHTTVTELISIQETFIY